MKKTTPNLDEYGQPWLPRTLPTLDDAYIEAIVRLGYDEPLPRPSISEQQAACLLSEIQGAEDRADLRGMFEADVESVGADHAVRQLQDAIHHGQPS